MKKISLIVVALMIFFSAGVSVSAETVEQQDVDVIAQYIQTTEGLNKAPIENGKGSLTTEEGSTVSVSGAPGTARYLVVCPISKDTEGGTWLIQCLNGRGNFICAYDIYFLDEAGNRISANGAIVTISSPVDTDNLTVYAVSSAGAVTAMNYSALNNCVTFTASEYSYYVFAEKAASQISATPTQTPDNGAGSNQSDRPANGENGESQANAVPKTADDTNTAGFEIALLISAAVIGIILKKRNSYKAS